MEVLELEVLQMDLEDVFVADDASALIDGISAAVDCHLTVMTGFYTLLYKELLRFWKVSFQTIAGPILTSLLYLLIFSHALEAHVQVYPGVAYKAVSGARAWR